MRPPSSAALSGPIMALLLASFLVNAISGIGWWLFSPSQFWHVFHGMSVPFFLISLGVIWRVHILRGWRLKKNRISGVLTLSIFLLLILTGWLIYYDGGNDHIQAWSGKIHTWLGLSISFLLFLHAILGWCSRDQTEIKEVNTEVEG